MCTQPVKIFTNSRVISKRGPTRLFHWFPCGRCAECVRQKKSEWRLRAYYEARRCFEDSRGSGFLLFDTLTYKADSIPWFHDVFKPALYNYWDFFAFSRKHVKDFFKRLRINLERSGYDVKDNLRYLLTCEYGGKSTRRSHYHILFYVNIPELDVIDFSRQVSRAWPFGFTDGVKPYKDCRYCPVRNECKGRCLYKSSQYVKSERLINKKSLNKGINYVTKYLTKDFAAFAVLEKRVFCSFDNAHKNINWQEIEEYRQEFRRFKNQVLPFHLQSVGFGSYALQVNDSKQLLLDNCLSMPVHSKKIIQSIPLPRYYKRKLLFNNIRFGGETHWYPKPEFWEYSERICQKSINNLSQKIQAWLNLPGSQSYEAAKYHLCNSGVISDREYNYHDLLVSMYRKPLHLYSNEDVVYNCQYGFSHTIVVKTPYPRYRKFSTRIKPGSLQFVHERKPAHRRVVDRRITNYLPRRKYLSDHYVQMYDGPSVIKYQTQDEFVIQMSNFFTKQPLYESIVDDFFDLQRTYGSVDNWLQFKKDRQRSRYKQLDLLK